VKLGENDAIRAALDALADMVATRVVERLRGPSSAGMQSQVDSPLGPRRHCAAVRRRVRTGDPDAQIIGRTFLLSREALAAEMAQVTRCVAQRVTRGTVEDELRHELGLAKTRTPGRRSHG
jgi:hypothetical protein